MSRFAPFVVAAGLLLAAGCTEPSSTGEAAPSAPPPPAFETVETGVLTACVAVTPAAVELAGDDGTEVVGFDVDLLRAVADGLGFELVLEQVAFDELVSGVALNSMRCDVGAGGVVDADALDAVARTSEPYRTVHDLVVALDAPPALVAPEEVTGRVGVEADGPAAASAVALTGAEVVELPSLADVAQALASGNVAAALVSWDGLAGVGADVGIVARVPTDERTVLLLPLGSDDDVVEAVDAQLATLEEDGTLAELEERWLGAPTD